MKRYLFFSLFILVVLSCQDKSDQTAGTTSISNAQLLPDPFAADTSSYRPIFYHKRLDGNAIGVAKTPLGGFGQALPHNAGDPIAQVLTSAYWVFEFYHDGAASIPQRKLGKGIWFRFNPDGTYTSGHWEDWTHSGTWILYRDGEHNYLDIDSNIDRHDARWDVQSVSQDQEEMGWARTNLWGYQKSGRNVQGKLIKLYSVPTKVQFGVE